MNAKWRTKWRDAAIQNNIDWYCAECDALGIAYERTDSTWHTTQRMPPYHSNLVTANNSDVDLIRWLDEQIDGEWSIKDAQATLDLRPLGFDKLFNAQWYVLEAGTWLASSHESPITQVNTAEQFATWIELWGETPSGQTVFDASLFINRAVGFLYSELPSCLGGLAFNHSQNAIGMTNTFGDIDAVHAAVAQLTAKYPDRAIVGYDRKEELAQLMQWGFTPTGALTIWKKRAF